MKIQRLALAILATSIYIQGLLAQEQESPGSLLLDWSDGFPSALTIDYELALANDLLAVCNEAQAAILPLTVQELKWLDAVTISDDKFRRGIASDNYFKIANSSAYIRDKLLHTVNRCTEYISGVFTGQTIALRSFPSRWAGAINVMFYLSEAAEEFRIAEQNDWLVRPPSYFHRDLPIGYGELFEQIAITNIPRISAHIAQNY